MNQLISITHKIHEALEQGEDICMVFLDVSKAFDRVYHEGLLFKLASFGISGSLLRWFKSYLSNRKQRVIINGQESDWQHTTAGVPQGSILGPLLFLVFVNDIVDNLKTTPFIFADDTSLMEAISDPRHSFVKANQDLATLSKWASQWQVTFNALKTEYMIISLKPFPPDCPELVLNGTQITQVTSPTHLGLNI